MTAAAIAPTRYPAFDVLRALCMFYIAFFHAALGYAEGFSWFVRAQERSAVLGFVVFLSMGWTLRVFFVLSGFFGYMVFQRSGWKRYAEHRLVRIGIPFVAVAIGTAHLLALASGRPVRYLPLHTWFLQYLLLISFLVPAIFALLARARGGRLMALVDRWFVALVTTRWAPVLLAAATTPLLWIHDRTGTLQPDGLNLQLEPTVFVYYFAFFTFGWLLFRHAAALSALASTSIAYLAIGLAARLVFFLLQMERGVDGSGATLAIDLGMVVTTSLYTWFVVLGAIGFFHGWVRVRGPIWRYLSDSSYWSYLFHVFPVVGLQTLLLGINLPPLLKFLIVCIGTAFTCLVTYRYFVRYTFIGWVLNGVRQRAGQRERGEHRAPLGTASSALAHGATDD